MGMKIEYGRHFRDMMRERGIPEEWVARCTTKPDNTEDLADGTKHFSKMIPEHENRWLRVIINPAVKPCKGITLFFDRRLRRKDESQGR